MYSVLVGALFINQWWGNTKIL